jgi:hypothetical protein
MAALSATERLAVAEIVLYVFLLPILAFVTFKHGKIGMVAWPTLVGVCAMRITDASVLVANRGNPEATAVIITSAFTSSGTLGALALAPTGVLYEA